MILTTTDGGTNRSQVNHGIPAPDDELLMYLFFNNDNIGMAVGYWGTMIRTTDGTNWSSISSGPVNQLWSIKFNKS